MNTKSVDTKVLPEKFPALIHPSERHCHLVTARRLLVLQQCEPLCAVGVPSTTDVRHLTLMEHLP